MNSNSKSIAYLKGDKLIQTKLRGEIRKEGKQVRERVQMMKDAVKTLW